MVVIAIGVDVGGTKIAAGAVSHDHSLSCLTTLPTPRGADAILERIAEIIRHVAADAGQPVMGIGLGLPSQVEFATGHVWGSTNIDLAGVTVPDRLADALPAPIVVDNDANVAALAEQRAGAGRGSSNVVMLTIGTGVGGGVVIDGALQRGGHGRGMELGHITIHPDGPPCQHNCPNHGCLETLVSGTAIARDAGRPAPEVVALARDGDADARAVLECAGRNLGIGIASLINIFAPDVVVIGGGVGLADGFLRGPAEEAVAQRALPSNAATPIVSADLDNRAGTVGAGILAWESLGV